MSAALIAFLASGLLFLAGNAIWNGMMGLIFGVMATTPAQFSSGTWDYLVANLYPMTLAIGTSLMNLFFLAGFFRQSSDFKQNLTAEILLGQAVKLVFANVLMQAGLDIMQGLFGMAAGLTGLVQGSSILTTVPEDIDAGTTLFGALFGILYFLVSLVCSFLIFFSVYGRFLQLYVIAACAPIGLSGLAGGQGLEHTGTSYIRTFLSKCFEIVIIAIALGLGARLCQGIDFGSMEGIAGWFDGAVQCLQNMAVMVLMAASAKGADSLMRRMFGL